MQIKKRGALTSVIIVLVLLFIMAPIGWKAMTAFMKSSLSREVSSDDLEIRNSFFNFARELRDAISDKNAVTISDHRIPVKLTILQNGDKSSLKAGYAIIAFDKDFRSIFAVVQKRRDENKEYQELVQIQRPINCTSSCICLVKTRVSNYLIQPKEVDNDYANIYDFNGAICENFGDNVKFYSLYESFKPEDYIRGDYAPYQKSTNLGYMYLAGAKPEYRFPNIPFIGITNLLDKVNIRTETTFLDEKFVVDGSYFVDKKGFVNIQRSYGYTFFSDQFVFALRNYYSVQPKEPGIPVTSIYFDKIDMSKIKITKDSKDNTITVFLAPNNVFSSSTEQESYIVSRKILLSQFQKKDQNSYARDIMAARSNTYKLLYFMEYLRYAFNPMLFTPKDANSNLKFLGNDALTSINSAISERLNSCNGIDKDECKKKYSKCDELQGDKECLMLLSFQDDYLTQQCKIYSSNYISIFKNSIGDDKFKELFTDKITCIELFQPEKMNKFIDEFVKKNDDSIKIKNLMSTISEHERNRNFLSAYTEYAKFFSENKDMILLNDNTVSAEVSTGELHNAFAMYSILAGSKDAAYEMTTLSDDDVARVYTLSTDSNSYLLVVKKTASESYLITSVDKFDLTLIESESDLDDFQDRVYLNKLSSYFEDTPETVYTTLAVLMVLKDKHCLKFETNRWPILFASDFAMECVMA